MTYHTPPPKPISRRRRRQALCSLHLHLVLHLLFRYFYSSPRSVVSPHDATPPRILSSSTQSEFLIACQNDVYRLAYLREALLSSERKREALALGAGYGCETVFLVAVDQHEEADEGVCEEHAEDEEEEDEDDAEFGEDVCC